MSDKRYFKRMWEEEYYIFDSNTISESDFEEKLEYQDYKAFEDSMMGDEVVNRLNEQHETIKQLRNELRIYRKVASCGNCKYHNYDWFDDGDEFEVCDKGNDVTEGICEDWREL